jgi:hypothetical protein
MGATTLLGIPPLLFLVNADLQRCARVFVQAVLLVCQVLLTLHCQCLCTACHCLVNLACMYKVALPTLSHHLPFSDLVWHVRPVFLFIMFLTAWWGWQWSCRSLEARWQV